MEDEYDIPLTCNPKVIVDLGSNIGASLIYLTLKYPGARIYGYEPDPYTYKALKENVNEYDNITVEQAAITLKKGETAFYADLDSSMSSSLKLRVGRQKKVMVKTTTLDAIINEKAIEAIDLLKFDVEGAEYDVFKNFQQIKKIENFIGELHVDLLDVSKEAFLSLFAGFNIQERLLALPVVERYIICGSKGFSEDNHQ